jgi:hypothetical protein
LFSHALTAKGGVYTLTLLFTCLCIWFVSEGDDPGKESTPFLILFVWSLGLANHWQTHLVWIPFLLGWAFQHRSRCDFKTLVIGLSWVAVGLSLYLYLPLRAVLHPLPFWGNPVHWEGFKWVVTRQLVSGLEPLNFQWDFYRSFVGILPRVYFSHWFPGFILGTLPGIYYLARERAQLLSGMTIVFVSVLGAVALVHEPKNIYLTPLYLLSLSGLVWLVASFGWWRLIDRIAVGKEIVFLLIFLAQCFWLYQVFNREEKSHYHLAEDFSENVLRDLPENSIMIAEGDHYVMGIWYELYGRGLRPDLVFEPGVFLVHDWGWRQIARQNPDWSGVAESPIFQERLKILTAQPLHPFFYSLDIDKLEPVFALLPGSWRREGLALSWRPAVLPGISQIKPKIMIPRTAHGFRWREDESKTLDPSSLVIISYYREGAENPKE